MDLVKLTSAEQTLRALVAETETLTLTDVTDEAQVKIIKEKRIALRDARLSLNEIGKGMRADALAFQKGVIAKEKELIAIVEPEEERLQALEDKAKGYREMQDRLAMLPERKQKILDLKITDENAIRNLTDDYILSFNATEFQGLLNKLLADKNEADRLANQKKEDELNKKQRDIDEADRIEKARLKGIEDEKLRQEREKKAEEDRVEREKLQKEKEQREEKERLEKDKIYQDFLKEHGVTPETKDDFKIIKTGDEIKVFKLVGSIIIK